MGTWKIWDSEEVKNRFYLFWNAEPVIEKLDLILRELRELRKELAKP